MKYDYNELAERLRNDPEYIIETMEMYNINDEEAYEEACKSMREESEIMNELHLCPFCNSWHSDLSDCSKDDLHNIYK